jgi:hypothetical protein
VASSADVDAGWVLLYDLFSAERIAARLWEFRSHNELKASIARSSVWLISIASLGAATTKVTSARAKGHVTRKEKLYIGWYEGMRLWFTFHWETGLGMRRLGEMFGHRG